jgi:hypothetical protein
MKRKNGAFESNQATLGVILVEIEDIKVVEDQQCRKPSGTGPGGLLDVLGARARLARIHLTFL